MSQESYQTPGQRVKSARLARGLSQERLAKLVPCNPLTILKVEHDRVRPQPAIAAGIARELGLDPADLRQEAPALAA